MLWWSTLKDHFNSNAKYSRPLKRSMFHAKTIFESEFVPSMDQKISCFLDPRYRFLKMLSEEDRTDTIRAIRCILDSMPNEPCQAVNVVSVAPPAKKSKFSHLEANDDDFEERDEVNVYIHSTQLLSYNLAESEFNVIGNFWKNNQEKLPKLFRLATSKLNTPACCCSHEKAISLTRTIKPEMLDDLLFIRDTF